MRREFIDALVQLATEDHRVVLMTGDLGFAALEPFAERFPERFFNVGVAEQNMMGMATGLAESGLVPFVYSISTFASMRAYEFIRNGPVVHRLPVRIIGVGEGADYSHNGITHYALEDVALMRAQPGLTVAAPASAGQVAPMLRALQDVSGPAYIRLSKVSHVIPGLSDDFEIGRAQRVGSGSDVAIIALGPAAGPALGCAEALADAQVQASVLSVTSVAPPPVEDLLALLSCTKVAITVEAHYVTGGLGSLVAEVIADAGIGCRLIRAGVEDLPVGLSGSLSYMNAQFGLTADNLAEKVIGALQPNQRVTA